jgi:hypothetical protein
LPNHRFLLLGVRFVESSCTEGRISSDSPIWVEDDERTVASLAAMLNMRDYARSFVEPLQALRAAEKIGLMPVHAVLQVLHGFSSLSILALVAIFRNKRSPLTR